MVARFLFIKAFLYVFGDKVESCVVLECSDLKPCWFSFTGFSINSLNGCFSVSCFAMGERTAIGLKLLDSSMGFPGTCRGITRPISLWFRFLHCLHEGLWCEWDISEPRVQMVWVDWGYILSGPTVIPLYFFVSLIASFTVLLLNILPSTSSSLQFFLSPGYFLWISSSF